LSIDEGYTPYTVYNSKLDSSTSGMGVAAPERLAVEPGSQEVSVDVTLRYEIK